MKVRKGFEKLSNYDAKFQNTQLSIKPIDYADPLFGVGSATSAGPCLPAGSVHISPETLENDCGGYLRNQPIIGFGHSYISGAGGLKCYGNYVMSPLVGDVEIDNAKRGSFAVDGSEISRCYEYKTQLENGIKIKMSPQHNAAIHSITYPANKRAVLLFDAAHKLDIDDSMEYGGITIDPESKTIFGGGMHMGNYNDGRWNMFFVLKFDTDFEEIGYFCGEEIVACNNLRPTTIEINERKRLGAYIKFPVCDNELNLKVKVAVSYSSLDKANEFLEAQIPEFDYEAVKENAKTKWNEALSVIELKTDDKALLRRFYTAMYHMNIQPRDKVSDLGVWDDFHTVWDSWKTVFPMYSLLYPKKMGEIIESFISRAEKNLKSGSNIVLGDQYMTARETLAGQGGNDVDNVIADAYLKGVKLSKYDWEDAYKVLLRSAETMRTKEYVEIGYVTDNAKTVLGEPYTWRCKSGSATLGFAFNDKAVAAVAKELGSEEEYKKYEERSANWLNVWNKNAQSEGFFGFPQGVTNDGEFEEGFDPHGGYNTHFYEATAWDASYINYNDVGRLVEAMGGKETFIKRLLWACEHSVNYYNDDNGKEGYLNFTNEPSFQIPWFFCTDEIKRPDLAAKVIDDIIPRWFALPDDYPGDEDNGGMASYFVFLMCGFFPFATTENYYLHGTRVEKITFRLGNGNEFIVSGENIGEKNIYVQSATWRGDEYNSCKLTHSQILEGGELHFVMGDKPSDWAKD